MLLLLLVLLVLLLLVLLVDVQVLDRFLVIVQLL